MPIVNSKTIADALMGRILDAKEGNNLPGTESMCRCIETLIKLARLEMDYAKSRNEVPQMTYLEDGINVNGSPDRELDKVKEALKDKPPWKK